MKIQGGETSQTKQVSGKNLDPYKLLDTNGMEASKQAAQAMQHLRAELNTLRSKHEAENLAKTGSIATTNNSSGTNTGQAANSKDNFVNKIFGIVDLIVKKLVQVRGRVAKQDPAVAQKNENKTNQTLNTNQNQQQNKLEGGKTEEVNLIKSETEVLSLPDSITSGPPQKVSDQNAPQPVTNVKNI